MRNRRFKIAIVSTSLLAFALMVRLCFGGDYRCTVRHAEQIGGVGRHSEGESAGIAFGRGTSGGRSDIVRLAEKIGGVGRATDCGAGCQVVRVAFGRGTGGNRPV